MSFIVVYRGSGVGSALEELGTLSEAVQFVEALRNSQGVNEARIFRAEEVPFDFRPYFRVEIGAPSVDDLAPVVAPITPPPTAPPVNEPPSPTRFSHDERVRVPMNLALFTDGSVPAMAPPPPVSVRDNVDENGVRRGLFGR